MTTGKIPAIGFGLLVVAFGLLTGCASGGSEQPDGASGRVSVALTGGSATGRAYRLRQGAITLQSPTFALAFNTDDYLGANDVTLEVPAGSYTADLAPGWWLEGAVGMDSWEPVEATLTSPNPIAFEVFDQATTGVTLTFRVGDDEIEMGNGRVVFNIFVDDSPVTTSDCVTACAEAEFLGCAEQPACIAICEDLPSLVGSPVCLPIAQDYDACAQTEPGMTYVCSSDYPVAGACEPLFAMLIECLTCPAGELWNGMQCVPCTDSDGDGVCVEAGDCDDADPNVSPSLAEACGDAIDNNCNGEVDESCIAGWQCDPAYYGAGDGCDCGCGVIDPDCVDSSSAVCDYCDDVGSCSTEPTCPGTISPMDNSVCL